jgi:hypothetical protein
MARMNISIPDALYARLDRLRDRVNASRVCAGALEKELDMIEARPASTDPEIEQLVARLQGLRERWYDRGRQDGKRWAVGSATREELYRFTDEYHGEAAEELVQIFLRSEHGPRPWESAGVDFAASLQRWLDTDEGDARPGAGDDGDHVGAAARPQVDEASYIEGWRDIVVEIWKAVSPRLRR